jgi:hypothetical protein
LKNVMVTKHLSEPICTMKITKVVRITQINEFILVKSFSCAYLMYASVAFRTSFKKTVWSIHPKTTNQYQQSKNSQNKILFEKLTSDLGSWLKSP